MLGSATIMVNPNKEVCAVHKAGGVGLTNSQFLRCAPAKLTPMTLLVFYLARCLALKTSGSVNMYTLLGRVLSYSC